MSDLIDAILAWPPTRQQLTDAVRAACQQAAIPLPADIDLRLEQLLLAFVRATNWVALHRRCGDQLARHARRLTIAIYDRICLPWVPPRRTTARYDDLYCDATVLWRWASAIVNDVHECTPFWWERKATFTRQDDTDDGDRWDGQS